jgi:hypothetical protein
VAQAISSQMQHESFNANEPSPWPDEYTSDQNVLAQSDENDLAV